MTHKKLNLPIEDRPSQLDEHGPVFILGCPRSGTTFLSNCTATLDSVEEFVGILFGPRFCHLFGKEGYTNQTNEIGLCVRDIFWQSFWRRRLCRHDRLIEVLKRNITITDFLAKPSMNETVFCYKEPFLAFAAKELPSIFPQAKYIHIIRDGRDNADSLERSYPHALSDQVLLSDELSCNKNSEIGFWKKVDDMNVPWWVPQSEIDLFKSTDRYGRCIMMWREMTLRGKSLEHLGEKQYLEIRYENLVKNPNIIGNEIADFLGKDLNRLTKRKLKKASTKSVGISQRNQSDERLANADHIAGKLLKDLGY